MMTSDSGRGRSRSACIAVRSDLPAAAASRARSAPAHRAGESAAECLRSAAETR